MPTAEITFTVDRTNIQAGECVAFHWKVEHVREVYFFTEGQRWEDHGVVGEGRRQECPSRSTNYSLRVVKQDGSVETRQIPIQVQPSAQTPQIVHFALQPSGRIVVGACVEVHWSVQGTVNHIRILRDGRAIWDGAPVQGHMQDCPRRTGSVTYALEANGPGGSNHIAQNLQVADQPHTPPPPPPPAVEKPVIHAFSVTPGKIRLGETVNLSWQTGGGTTFARIVSGDDVVIRNAPLSGTATDQPHKAGTVPYRIIAYNPDEKRVYEVRQVTVVP
jgi:hypothetical protein